MRHNGTPGPLCYPVQQQQYQHFQVPPLAHHVYERQVVSGGYSNTKLQGYGPQTGSTRPAGTRRPQPVYRPNPQQETEKEREEEEKRETDRASLVELMMEKAREAARKAAKEEETESEAKEKSQDVPQRQTPVPRNPPEMERDHHYANVDLLQRQNLLLDIWIQSSTGSVVGAKRRKKNHGRHLLRDRTKVLLHRLSFPTNRQERVPFHLALKMTIFCLYGKHRQHLKTSPSQR
ncbi:hypothetical protein FJT64_006921 [Amphibalanus amphitrite]|uniref:Uncharacterized protein n=1 Tax=Amphibalanus amphitrite TaxID=1232801 RepID=A0A6A4W0G5_AMPAM|nr:hypothetical protein FJT64_006921 [Amphibalanus amphitrite]